MSLTIAVSRHNTKDALMSVIKDALFSMPRTVYNTKMFFHITKILTEPCPGDTGWTSTFRSVTYHKETESTGCSPPPSPHTCLQPSAYHCRSWRTQRLRTPPKTYTPGHCYRRQHSAVGSCRVRGSKGYRGFLSKVTPAMMRGLVRKFLSLSSGPVLLTQLFKIGLTEMLEPLRDLQPQRNVSTLGYVRAWAMQGCKEARAQGKAQNSLRWGRLDIVLGSGAPSMIISAVQRSEVFKIQAFTQTMCFKHPFVTINVEGSKLHIKTLSSIFKNLK